MKIAIDAMGGDFGPEPIIEGVIKALKEQDFTPYLVGDEKIIKPLVPKNLYKKKPGESLKLAVKRMLPRGPLAKKQLSKLKIYKGTLHPHESQNPKIIDFSTMNKKNYFKTIFGKMDIEINLIKTEDISEFNKN